MKRSFIVTGAPATGKTSLINEAIRNGYTYLPMHLTRAQRSDEIAGVHGIFISQDEFMRRFESREYLEPSIEYARNYDTFYGTPKNHSYNLSENGFCSTPITPLIANKIRQNVDVLWVCLICNVEERRLRLSERKISEIEIEGRLLASKDHCIVPENALVFDTSILSTFEILKKIMELPR